ncbi:MAG: metallophosphoesterase family protein [Patescibacteria group bacterium]
MTLKEKTEGKIGLAGKEAASTLSRLIDAVTRKMIAEQKAGQGKLGATVRDIHASGPFTDWPIVFLPSQGEAIFVGDTHGDSLAVSSVVRAEGFVERVTAGEPLFLVVLGDVSDRGKGDIKNISLLLSLKKQHPNNVFLLRGNHEEMQMNQYFGLLGSCLKFFDYDRGQEIFEQLNGLFERWPSLAVTGNGIVAVHGGLPVVAVNSLRELNDDEASEEMRWNDPSEDIDNFVFNYQRGSHYLFGRQVFDQFMEAIGGSVLVRSHEYVSAGYKFLFGNKLVTIFSNGGTSEESGYQDFILAPKYVKVSLAKPIDRWTKQHIIDIPYHSQ